MAFATASVLKIKSWKNDNGSPEGSFSVFFFCIIIFAIFTEEQMQIKKKTKKTETISPECC